jgi:hypothetical protein
MQNIKKPLESLARIWSKTVGLWPEDRKSHNDKKWLLTRFYNDTGHFPVSLPKQMWPKDIKRFEWIESIPIKKTERRGILKRNLRFGHDIIHGHVFQLDFNDPKEDDLDPKKLSHVIFTSNELDDLRDLYRLPVEVEEQICEAYFSCQHLKAEEKDMWPHLRRGSVWSKLVNVFK